MNISPGKEIDIIIKSSDSETAIFEICQTAELKNFRGDYTIINFPGLKLDPKIHGTRSETVIAVNLKEKIMAIVVKFDAIFVFIFAYKSSTFFLYSSIFFLSVDLFIQENKNSKIHCL